MEENDNITKYQNWKAITESDYVTMFIKTWFAFVATLRDLSPDEKVFTEEGKPRGDRPFTNCYKENYLSYITTNLDIVKFIEDVNSFYIKARKKIANVFPQYFFQTFYRMNESFNYNDKSEEKDSNGKIKECRCIDVKLIDRFKIKGAIRTNGEFRNKNYGLIIPFELNIKPFIASIDLSEEKNYEETHYLVLIYKYIKDELTRITTEKLENKLKASNFSESLKRKIKNNIFRCLSGLLFYYDFNLKPPISDEIRPINTYCLVKQYPLQLFSESIQTLNTDLFDNYCGLIKENGISWFIDFVVSLRNALFHEIIDPLDNEWQEIFKTAYFILKNFLDKNVELLSKKHHIPNDLSNKIYEYISNEIPSCLDELSTHTRVLSVEDILVEKHDYNIDGEYFFEGSCNVVLALQFGSDQDVTSGDGDESKETRKVYFKIKLDDQENLVKEGNNFFRINIV
ncbi:MAG: hypothetical protein J6N93_02555 [Clostridia bacterium]|nr:hypothetical protein [Clostridia bacterium]